MLMYPMLVTDPHWKKEENFTSDKDDRSFNFQSSETFLKPIVNRLLKPTAERKYVPGYKENNEISDLVQRKRRLVEELVGIRKETNLREAELSNITTKTCLDESLDSDTRKAALREREQIAYLIMELEDNGNNTTALIEDVDRKLKRNGLENVPDRIELMQEEKRKEDELRRLEEERNAIKLKHKKEREQAELRETQRRRWEEAQEEERLKVEREKQKELAKRAEEKRLKDLAAEQERGKVIQPLFDRTNKPKEIIAPWSKLIQNRNFYPVQGSEVSISTKANDDRDEAILISFTIWNREGV